MRPTEQRSVSSNKKERVPGGPLSRPFGSTDRYEVSMTDGVNIAFLPAVARAPRGRGAPRADHGGASFRGKISFTIGALSWSRAPRHFAEFHGLENGCQPQADP